MNATHGQIQLDDGRRLGYAEYGDPKGKPMLYCHGLPASRLEAAFCDTAAKQLGIRIVAVDRPGYGLSDFQAQRLMSGWPDDVLQLTGVLGIERFAVMGVSGGGPYALACAWKIPEQLSAVKIVCGLAPLDRPEALRAMNLNARLAFGLARRSQTLLGLTYGMAVATGPRIFPTSISVFQWLSGAPADRVVMGRSGVRGLLLDCTREGLRQGFRGPLWDTVLYAREWGFALEQVTIPVELWHGTADTIVPPSHVQILADALPHATVNLLEGEGHYSLPIEHCKAILA